MGVTIAYEIRAAPGSAGPLVEVFQRARNFGLTVDGCEAYEIYQCTDDPERLLVLERWASPEAQQDHFERNVKGSGVLQSALSLMAEPPREVRYLRR